MPRLISLDDYRLETYLDGALIKPSLADPLLDFDPGSCRVPALQREVWEGFVFINLDPGNTRSVPEFLGEFGEGIEGYAFEGPHQVYRLKAKLKCNRKF